MHSELMALMPMVRRYAYALTGSGSDADDLLQNTMERVLTRGVPNEATLSKWVFRVCRNLWIDDYRARKVRNIASHDPELIDTQIVDGEKAILAQISLQEVNVAMATLSDEQRAILALVALQGLSYKEVAETLSIPLGTVMSRLARARVALSQSMNTAAVRRPHEHFR